jgi:hypothetical protein
MMHVVIEYSGSAKPSSCRRDRLSDISVFYGNSWRMLSDALLSGICIVIISSR